MSELSLREVRSGDHAQIEDLKRRYELPAYSEAEWRHLYEQSPLLRRREIDWPWGWVLEDAGGVIHGHLGNVPVEYSFEGRSVAAAAASDWVVEEHSRGQSLQLVLSFFRRNPAELLLNTTASPEYGRAYEALGARQPDLDGYDRRLTWPIERRKTASVALRQKGRSGTGPLALLAGAGLVPLGLAGAALRAPAGPRARRVERCSEFDERFDEFSRALERRDGLFCVRDAEALRWRYGRGLASGDVWVHTQSDGDAISACLIAAKVMGGTILRGQLIDFQDLNPSGQRTAALLSSVLRRCREEGVAAFQAAGVPQAVQRRFARLGGFPQRIPQMGFYFKAGDPELHSRLERPGSWTPSPYDGDAMCGTPRFLGVAA